MNWDPEPIATRALARAEGKKPQPSEFWQDFQRKVNEPVADFAADQHERTLPRRTFPRRLAVFLVVAAVLVVVAVAWLVTS